MNYPAVTLASGKERALRNRHPWVFSGAVAGSETQEDGAVVRVVGASGETFGYGHIAPRSPIRVRIFQFSAAADLHFPAEYWQAKLQQAADHRLSVLDTQQTTGYRLVNAEGDSLPGLVIDRYGEVAVVQARGAGMVALQPIWLGWLVESVGVAHVLRKAETGEDSLWLLGQAERCDFQECGLTYEVEPRLGQKTGFFLDQRDARSLIGRLANGRSVLNVFSYSGGFGVAALAGGARNAVSVDISADACALASQNAELNGFSADRHQAVCADAFDYLRTVPSGAADLIVLDPPAFTKHIGTVERAARGYKDINFRALKLLPPGGLLATFSCSQPISRELFRKILFGAAADASRSVRVLFQTGHPPDHPVDLFHPEGDYLKGFVLQVS